MLCIIPNIAFLVLMVHYNSPEVGAIIVDRIYSESKCGSCQSRRLNKTHTRNNDLTLVL